MDTIVTKICKRCEREKSIEEFYNEDLKVLGEGKYCRDCLLIKLKLSSASTKVPEKSFRNNKKRYGENSVAQAQILRKIVLAHYGNRCECCGESNYEFLAIDHINSDGGKMRRNKEHPIGGYSFYAWIIKNEFPNIFRVLCHNCNSSLGYYGYCPHKNNL